MAILYRFARTLRFIGAYTVANVQAAMEYRVSFWMQIITMVANDSLWLFFWWTYFHQFPLANGWRRTDFVILLAVSGFGFGSRGWGVGDSRLDCYVVMHEGVRAYSCQS